MKKHADKKLVKQLMDGDKKAFSIFFNSYFSRLFYFARDRLWDNEDWAEEAVQNAMSKAVQKLHTYRGEAALYTWLCTFCRHEISAIIQKENKQGNKVDLVEDDPNVRAALESLALFITGDPFLQYKQSEVIHFVQVAKNHIPTLYSDILEWKYIYGYSVKEIAEKIGRSQKATESVGRSATKKRWTTGCIKGSGGQRRTHGHA